MPETHRASGLQTASQLVAATTGLAVALAGFVVLIGGWYLDVGLLRHVNPGWATMKANTAIGFMASGVAVALIARCRSASWNRFAVLPLGAFVAAIGLSTLFEYASGRDLGIDQLLFVDADLPARRHPGRMSPMTAIVFATLGIAIALTGHPSRWAAWSGQALSVLVSVSGGLAILGYVFGAADLHAVIAYMSMALHTAVCVQLLGLATIAAQPDRGLMRLFVGEHAGGLMARRLVPAAVAVPMTLGWLVVKGQELGWYDTSFGVAILVGGFIAIIVGVILMNVRALDDADEVRRLNVELDAKVAEVTEARNQATIASRAKSDFLASMSHELRTPLNAVIGFAQLLELNRERNLTAAQIESCRIIASGGTHLLNIVTDVLDLSAIESGRVNVSIERVDVAASLARVRDLMAPLAAKAGIGLSIAEPSDVRAVRADRLRLQQCLINLVSNAIKYSKAGASVSVTVRPADADRIRFLVADTGIGIHRDRQLELFKPFQRIGAEFSAIEGVGIGLALTKRLVEAMAGDIGFASEQGKGSSFWIDLPVDTTEQQVRAAAPDAAHLRAASGGYSLLYIEDNPTSLHLMERLVSGLSNVRMLSAPTPQLGLDLAMVHRPDIIVLDLNLPGMHGLEVLARLQGMPETREIPVLALTASAMPHDVRHGLTAGFFRYLTKPIDIKEFLAAINDALLATARAEARAPAIHVRM